MFGVWWIVFGGCPLHKLLLVLYCGMGLFSDYNDGFEHACELHVDILHSDSEKHFAVISLGRSIFNNIDLSEFDDGLRSQLETPIVLLQSPIIKYKDNGGDSKEKKYVSALVVLKAIDKSDKYASRKLIWTDCERIGEELLGYAHEKFNKASFANFRNFDVGSIRGDFVGPVKNDYYGVRFDFDLELSGNTNLFYNGTKFGE